MPNSVDNKKQERSLDASLEGAEQPWSARCGVRMSPSPSSRVGCRGRRGERDGAEEAEVSQRGFGSGEVEPCESAHTSSDAPHSPRLWPQRPAGAGCSQRAPGMVRGRGDHRGPRQRGQGPVPGTRRRCLCASGGVPGAASILRPCRATSIPCRGSAAACTPAACPTSSRCPASSRWMLRSRCWHCCPSRWLPAVGRRQRLVPVGALAWPLQKPGWEAWLLHPAHCTAVVGC